MAKGKTMYKDKHGETICYGDFIRIEEPPGKYVGGSYDFEGIVDYDENEKRAIVRYKDFSLPLRFFYEKEISRRAKDEN